MMAVDAFREALMAIPEAIAENAGHDPVDVRANLIQAHSDSNILSCIEIENGGIIDAFDAQIVEPQSLHIQAITSAVEAAVMILRIDDVISMNPEGARNPMG
jgi:chaperonin GroEL (HSP60 family)